MRALVIGGNGFIGSALVPALQARGADVAVLDPGRPRADVDWRGVEFIAGSLADPVVTARALSGVDVVFHLASTTVPGTSNLDPVADVQGNLVATLGLLGAMRSAGVRRIVYFSSGGTVYGNPTVSPVPESHPLHPISSYGVVKVAIENYLRMYQQLGDLDPVILRPSNPYGPRQSTAGVQGAVAAFLGAAARGEPVSIWGDGEVVRDYIYIDDLVELAATAGLSQEVGVFNVGSGEGHSLNALVAMVSDVVGRPLAVEYQAGRAFDVRRVVLDVGAARRGFAWSPHTSLREGLAATWRALAPP
ncbi:MAG TPA: NAD-dependent epimerase/dehydratase family protein [Arenimonas sp.]|uniref:NAD-dependent epimerase/dehydratase family protein n=1 Tax=Arenimonas sp. TaxID=1872635 RepID=UPI002D7EE776|nr:NAD-dependent epimerase/dehydratase family protein [Arenimonas sp.]HEU0151718.1 NAD-dependent epimerase/dehydratase family protein [Arenimonas sp.]